MLFYLDEINCRMENTPEEFIDSCEKSFRERINALCDSVLSESGRVLVMLAGPSSSGKTTTANLLADGIRKAGRGATVISLDDFYLGSEANFTFEDGTVDYETVKALDLPCISSTMRALLRDGEAMVPRFNFKSGSRDGYTAVKVQEDEVIILEGLHALNPLITDPLSDENMIKLYISVSSRIADENGILMTKRDLRFIRRLIRDYRHRNSDAERTFYLWKGVRMGEDRYLFPFSDRADIKIDSIHPYEVCVFRKEAEKLLDSVAPDSIYYTEAKLLKDKITKFTEKDSSIVPEGSLLNEFIG
ncbi:MAG: nucleoside kinase [Clostridia bacterium]|nr:nucleoside kinase [Clostridia bacterium]